MNKNFTLVSVYAHAFLLMLQDKKVNYQCFLTTNTSLVKLFNDKNSQFWNWLQSLQPLVAKQELQLIFGKRIDIHWLNLMFVLIEDYNLVLLPFVFSLIKKLLQQKLKIKIAHLYSAISLKPEQLLKIKKKLEQKFTCTIELMPKLDVNLIAGIRLEIDNRIFDNSLQKKLNDFRQSLF